LIALLHCLVACSILITARGDAAQSERFRPDVRAQGMGRASTAIAEGNAAGWSNPAALALSEAVVFTPWNSTSLDLDLPESLDVSVIGVAGGLHGIGAGIDRTRYTYPAQVAVDFSGNVVGEFRPTERSIFIGGGIEVLQFLGVDTGRFRVAAGVNWKDVHLELAPAAITRDGIAAEGSTWDLDVGTLLSFRPGQGAEAQARPGAADPRLDLRAAVVVDNVRDAEIALVDEDQTDPLGRRIRLGGAVEAHWWERPPFDHVLKATTAVDFTSFHGRSGYRNGDRDGVLNLGAEISLLGMFAWRVGYIRDTAGGLQDWTWGLGIGADLRFDRPSRIGLRYDLASIPQAGATSADVKYHSLSVWMIP
jgi:hypothetical protein